MSRLKQTFQALLIISTILTSTTSCNNESTLSLSSVTTELVDKTVRSKNYQALFTEMVNMSNQIIEEKLVIKQASVVEMQQQIANSTSLGELEAGLTKGFGNPKIVLLASEKINSLFRQLDNEIHFSVFSKEDRRELFKRAFDHSISKASFTLAFNAVLSHSRISLDNCAGLCNTVYYHAIENAASALLVATGVAFLGGTFGGPAGMALGALGIAGAVTAYFVAENFAIVALGDCFDACPR